MKTNIILLLTIALFSCNQNSEKINDEVQLPEENVEIMTSTEIKKFKTLAVEEINQQLKEESEELTAKGVMKLYYPVEVESNEGNEKIIMSETKTVSGNSVVTLIHDNLLDDSQQGVKFVMELQKTDNNWTVISIQKNWKCWDGRGHTDWGIELCH